MKKAFIGFILLCVLYFIGGWALVVWGPMPMNIYVISASIAGSLASVLGLLSFVRSGLTSQDLKTVEIDTLKEIGQLSKQLEEIAGEKERLTKEKNLKETEIEKLERQRREMDALVKKASLILLYENDIRNLQHQIESFIQSKPDLQSAIQSFRATKEKLDALGQEVETSEDAELLSWMLNSAKERERRLEHMPTKRTTFFDFIMDMVTKASISILRF